MPTYARECPSCHASLPDEARFCLRCGQATPTEPGVPPRTMPTGEFEVAKVRQVLADRYKVERVVGEGGMATVYLAEDLKHHRKVAVKVMRPELAATLGSDRFLREVEIAAQLNHPHILPMYDSGEADGILYYVMPYVEGESLAARLARGGELPVREALRLALEVAEALGYAHKRGIIHRDIKPANILISEGHALVADFGIARAVSTGGEAITATGLAIGTPQYMSPEQATGSREVDSRTDLYALGAVLYEMLTGEPPFTGRTPQAVVSRSLTERHRPLGATREGLPEGLEDVVTQALAKTPADRFDTAGHLVEALGAIDISPRKPAAVPAAPAPAAPAAPVQEPSSGNIWTVFGGVSLLALTIVAFMAGKWGLPTWVLGAAVLLAAAGVAMLALTARAERQRRAGNPPTGLAAHLTRRNAALGGMAAMVAWAGVAAVASARRPAPAAATAGAADGTHVAVLPFQNQGDSADNYIVDGITDEVRGKLARVNGLVVIASGSSNQFRGTTAAPAQIASQLGAAYLVSGRVRWAGVGGAGGARRMQVVSELVDGKTGATRWQQAFDADLTDVFEVQAQIAARVVGALGTQLGAQDTRQLARRPTASPAAWDAYLKGRAITALDPGSQRQASAHFEQAVALDSAFTEAWAGLSQAQAAVFVNGAREPRAAQRAREAAMRAVATDPNHAAGHAATAHYYIRVAPDPDSARRYLGAALQLAPNDRDVLLVAARADLAAGRTDMGIQRLERAREVDPRSANVLSDLLRAYLTARRYTEAEEIGDAAVAVSVGNPIAYEYLAMVRTAQGDIEGARAASRRAVTSGIPPAEVAATFAGYFEMSWVLEPELEALVFRLSPAAFDGDRAWWGQSLATAHWVRGRHEVARAYADSGLEASAAQARAVPNDPAPAVLYALMLAYAGREGEAIQEVRRALSLVATQLAFDFNYNQFQAARVYLVLGDRKAALTELEKLGGATYVTPQWLRLDPLFASLKGDPRFERLANAQ